MALLLRFPFFTADHLTQYSQMHLYRKRQLCNYKCVIPPVVNVISSSADPSSQYHIEGNHHLPGVHMNRPKKLIHLRPCLSPVLMINTVIKEGLMQSGLKPIFIKWQQWPSHLQQKQTNAEGQAVAFLTSFISNEIMLLKSTVLIALEI